MEKNILFEEKQYLGFNTYSIARRMVLAIFCFVAFYYSENRMENADILFLLGIVILILNFVLLFVRYLQIIVTDKEIILVGMWRNQAKRFNLSEVKAANKIAFSKFHLNNPVFNLHDDYSLKFYAVGNDAVKVDLVDGKSLIIGTLRAEELSRILSDLTK